MSTSEFLLTCCLQRPGETFSERARGIGLESVSAQGDGEAGLDSTDAESPLSANEVVQDLVRRAGGPEVAGAVLYRKSQHPRANAKTDPYALKAWCWKVLADANESRPAVAYERGAVDPRVPPSAGATQLVGRGSEVSQGVSGEARHSALVLPHLPRRTWTGPL